MPEQLPITTYGMNVLRQEANPVDKIDKKTVKLVENMFYTMINANGIGLAAPQVNQNISLAVIDISCIEEFKNVKPLALFNPVILETHGEETLEEGCLSIPELRAPVNRPDKIYLKYNNFDLKEVMLEAGGMLARVIQHEIDHLHGILFVDHLEADELKKYQSHLRKIKKGKIETEYPLFLA